MTFPAEELKRRRPVWAALSELFLDTELQEHHFAFVARVLAESEYSDSEILAILLGEVFPVCIANLHHPAGEWVGFGEDWLEHQIGQRKSAAVDPSPGLPADFWMIENEWLAVLARLPQAREQWRWRAFRKSIRP